MLLGKVVGTVTATRKTEALSGYKFLLVQPRASAKDKHDSGAGLLVAVDATGAGVGEDVILSTGRAARIAIGNENLPVDATVIGIVDGIDAQ